MKSAFFRPIPLLWGDGGPGANAIVGYLTTHSSTLQQNVSTFVLALIYNWVIGGTDADAKNYALLLFPNNVIRLVPLSDMASYLVQKAVAVWEVGYDWVLKMIHAILAESPAKTELVLRAMQGKRPSEIQKTMADRFRRELDRRVQSIRKLSIDRWNYSSPR